MLILKLTEVVSIAYFAEKGIPYSKTKSYDYYIIAITKDQFHTIMMNSTTMKVKVKHSQAELYGFLGDYGTIELM